jgi:monoamine oxidase
MSTNNVIIVGGGLSGLTLAYLLQKKNISTTLLEASNRLGGRIETVQAPLGTPLEMGATWFADQHFYLMTLVRELGLQPFPQYAEGIALFQTKSFEPPQQFYVPESEQPSYRLAGGTQMVIDTLAEKLAGTDIRLEAKVTAIQAAANGIEAVLADGSALQAGRAVVCIPPQLAATSIQFSPTLPDSILQLLPAVQTWMAGSVKFAIEYATPFWRNKGFSGMLYSHAGIIMEMYDHCSKEEDRYGFTGFLNGGAAQYSQEVRREYALRQLGDLLGEEALHPSAYHDKVWTGAFIADDNPVILRPHQNNGHPLLQQAYMNGALHFATTETATAHPGYMDGAVEAAMRVAACI